MRRKPETGLVLPVGNPNAKTIMLLRKLTPLSIAEIKRRALAGEPFTEFEGIDEYGIEDDEVLLRSIRRAHRDLHELGIDARIVLDGREESSEFLDNHIQTLKEIGEEIDWEDEVAFAQEEAERAVAELSEEHDDFNWWVPEDMGSLLDELERELPDGHPLAGRNLVPMAKNDRNGEVLFHDGSDYLLVHLTWSPHNDLPFPLHETLVDDVAAFLQNDYLDGVEEN